MFIFNKKSNIFALDFGKTKRSFNTLSNELYDSV